MVKTKPLQYMKYAHKHTQLDIMYTKQLQLIKERERGVSCTEENEQKKENRWRIKDKDKFEKHTYT